MTHQLAGKKWSYEVPPLDWKAPDADKKSDRDAADARADSPKKAEASASKA